MELIDHTTQWVKGEVNQGKVMLLVGTLLIIASIVILKNGTEILKGMIVPSLLAIVALIGYGAFQVTSRPKHIEKVSSLVQKDRENALATELAKAKNDDKVYTILKKVWAGMIVLGLILFFTMTADYTKGIGLGVVFLGFTLLMLDTTLHHRLVVYMQAMMK